LHTQTDYYNAIDNGYSETHQRLAYFEDFIENKGGYCAFYLKGKAVGDENDFQLLFRLVW
jgi:hypothetical protein